MYMNGGGGDGGNYPPACAACMHQRKRCEESCELAPYFPAAIYDEFQNAYKLFGLSNIVSIMNLVEPDQRQAAAESILIEGNARLNYPVHGCLGVISNLQSLIRLYESELQAVNQQLAFFKGNHRRKQQADNSVASSSSSTPQPSQPGINDYIGGEEEATIKFLDTHPTDHHQTMDLNQNGGKITSVPSDATGKQPAEPDEEAKKDEA